MSVLEKKYQKTIQHLRLFEDNNTPDSFFITIISRENGQKRLDMEDKTMESSFNTHCLYTFCYKETRNVD